MICKLPAMVPSFLLVTLSGILASSCSDDVERVTVIGLSRNPGQDCDQTERAFHFNVERSEVTIPEEPPEWCGLMDERMVCFLHEQNGRQRNGVELPRELPHADVPMDHEDLQCWSEELAEWDADWMTDPDKYHPVWSNDWSF